MIAEQGQRTRSHILKTWPGPFEALLDGTKTFELRFDDRAYAVGDVLVLQEYDPSRGIAFARSGREVRKLVTYRCVVAEWIDGVRGWVVLGLGEPL